MGLNSGDWGNIVGTAVGAYNPQVGAAVNGLFQKPAAKPVQPAVLAAPQPVAATVPVWAWTAGGVLVVIVVVLIAVKMK